MRCHLRYDHSIGIAKLRRALSEPISSDSSSCLKLAEDLAASLSTVSHDIVFLRCQGDGIDSVKLRSGRPYQLMDTPDSQRHSPSEL